MDILSELINYDRQLFLFLNGIHNGFFDVFMHTVSRVAVWIPFYVAVAWAIVYKYGRKGWILILALVIGVVLTDQISVLVKNYFERLRPSHQASLADLIHLYKGHKSSRFGFVSSHATNMAGFAVLSSLFIRNKFFSYSVAAWALLTCYSRIYLGLHFPADVTGGAILGVAIAVSVYAVLSYYVKDLKLKTVAITREKPLIPILVLGLSIFSFLVYSAFVC